MLTIALLLSSLTLSSVACDVDCDSESQKAPQIVADTCNAKCQKEREEDRVLNAKMNAFKESRPQIDFDAKDSSGLPFEFRVLEFALSEGIADFAEAYEVLTGERKEVSPQFRASEEETASARAEIAQLRSQ